METNKRRISIRIVLGRLALLLMVILIAAIGVTDLMIRNRPIPICSGETPSVVSRGQPTSTNREDIKCPFLKLAMPASTGLRQFARDAEKHGMEYTMAVVVAMKTTWEQKGLLAVLRGETPDIYALDQVRGVSHCDRYARYIPEIYKQAKDMEVDGQITLQDLVALKKWIAEQEQVDIITPSKMETALVFIRAGGNFDTGKVYTEDVFKLLNGEDPDRDGLVTPAAFSRAQKMAVWD